MLGMVLTPTELILIAIAVASMLAIHLLLRATQLGKAMRAASADRELASGCGINVALMTTITWALSGTLAGLGGVALALNTAAFSPVSGDQFVFIVFAAAVVGGLGQPYGAMLGALAIGIVTEEFAIIDAPLEVCGGLRRADRDPCTASRRPRSDRWPHSPGYRFGMTSKSGGSAGHPPAPRWTPWWSGRRP